MIGGSGSSGTTLLSHLLNSHPSIYCGDELQLLNKKSLYLSRFPFTESAFRELLGQGVPTELNSGVDALFTSICTKPVRECGFLLPLGRYGMTAEDVVKVAAESGSFKEFVDRFFQKVLAKAGKQRWAEKTPTNCFCIGEFLSLYPDGVYIHVVRDGRDAVPSLIKKGFSPPLSVAGWIALTAAGLPYRRHERFYQLKYEDLVTDPEEALARLMKFLRMEVDPQSLLERAVVEPVFKFVSPTWGAKPNEPISQASIGKWKRPGYPYKSYLEHLFSSMILTEELSRQWGLPDRTNGNVVLRELGYEPSDGWDPSLGMDWQKIKLYVRARFCEMFHQRKSVFRFSLS